MFKKRKFSNNQINLISRIHEVFAYLTASSLSGQVRSFVNMKVASVKQMTYKNFISLIPVPTTLAMIKIGALKSGAILEIDPALTFSIIDRLCGGTGGLTKALHELTDIEASLIEGIIIRVMRNMRIAWKLGENLKLSLNRIDTNFMLFDIVNPTDTVVVISMETAVGDGKGMMNICIPYTTAEALIKMSSEKQINKTSIEYNASTNKKDDHSNLTNEIKELKQNFLEFKDELNSKIAFLIKEDKKDDKNIYEQKASEKAQDRKVGIIEALAFAVNNHVEKVVELMRICLEQDDRRRAAIFLICLGSELSIEIYKHLTEYEIETLTSDIARLETIDSRQKTSVLEEFYESYTANQNASTGGIDYARVLLEGSVGAEKAIKIINRLTSSLQVRPFDFIRRTDPAYLFNFIQKEHPQIIALVLAYLAPNKASYILQNLPNEAQGDVAKRIATIDRTSPEVLREVERVLEKKLSEDYMSAGGIESITEIINLVDRASEKQIIEALEDEEPELAEEIKKRMFVFEDIVMLDDRAIQTVLRELDLQDLAKALKAVDPEVQNKIFKNMSKKAAGMLKEDMEFMGPIRLREVEETQSKIISIIRRLEDANEIVIARAGEDELVV